MARKSIIKTVIVLFLSVFCASQAWAQSGEYRYDLTIYDDGQGNNLRKPAGVTCGEDRIIVADTANSRLLFYTLTNGAASLVREIKLTRQIRPTTVQLGAGGQVLVYDARAKEILRFDSAGNRNGKIEPAGIPGGSRVIPKSFRTDSSGSVYLLDIYGRRVVILDRAGAFVRQIAFPQDFGFFSDLAVNGRGTVFILDSVRSQVLTASPEDDSFSPLTQDLKENISYPTYMEVDSKGLIYIVDEETSTMGVLRRDGSFIRKLFNRGRKEGLLYYPSQICVEDGTRIVIADRDNNRVQMFVEKE
ncbi:MAG: NHL repeat-containing protein [Pseudomonadota bacterium]|jgi:hypothetical protein